MTDEYTIQGDDDIAMKKARIKRMDMLVTDSLDKNRSMGYRLESIIEVAKLSQELEHGNRVEYLSRLASGLTMIVAELCEEPHECIMLLDMAHTEAVVAYAEAHRNDMAKIVLLKALGGMK